MGFDIKYNTISSQKMKKMIISLEKEDYDACQFRKALCICLLWDRLRGRGSGDTILGIHEE